MQTGICKNCGSEIWRYDPEYYDIILESEIPWLHIYSNEEFGTWCRVTKAEPLDE